MPLYQRELDRVRVAAAARVESTVALASRICEVPAPTGHERERAEFVARELEARGYSPEIDEIGNVYVRRGRGSGRALMLLAHTDTVFPAGTDTTVVREDGVVRGPGVGDNSLGVAAMLETLSLLDALEVDTDIDIIGVANVGEEGLGNLKGARAAVARHHSDLAGVIAVEGHNLGRVTHGGVGSVRIEVTVRGPGGHSWGDFGKPSAIHALCNIVSRISAIVPPTDPKTTYSVGSISGGVSINTIAPLATARVDMRSVDADALQALVSQVTSIVNDAATADISVEIETLGERPAGVCPLDDPLPQSAASILKMLGFDPIFDASSTDANVPISLGIPAICVGVTSGGGSHTTSEHITVAPIAHGLTQLVALCIAAAGAQGWRSRSDRPSGATR